MAARDASRIRQINRSELISKVAEKTNYYKSSITEIFDAIEEVVSELILEADETEDVEIRLIDGIKVFGQYLPEREMEHPKTKERIIVKPKIRPDARCTQTYRKKIKHQSEDIFRE